MAKKKFDKLDGAFLDFDPEAANSLDQIFNNISSFIPSDNISETEFTDNSETLNESSDDVLMDNAEASASAIDYQDYYNDKIFETLEDIEDVEKSAVEVALANIDNLYKGSFVHDYAKQYHLTESEVKEKLRLELAAQLNAWGMKYVNKRHYALPREIKHIIRMDFYGTVDKVKNTQRLEFLRYHSNPENTVFNNPSDYDLTQSPTWVIFRQFRSFQLLEKNLPELLIEQGITPKDFPRLNAYEISQILYNHYIKHSKPGAKDAERANLFLGAKFRFVKAFIRKNREAFKNYMDMKGYDPRYTKTLIRHMELYGTTGNIDVLKEAYTPEIIEVLTRRKLIPEETKAGDPITDKQAELIKAHGLLGLILERDANGDPVTGPEFTVHHKTAVQDSGENTNFAEVNLFKNLCLIVEPYHYFAHSLDRTGTVGGAEYYVSRIEISKNISFYGGFNSLYQIEQDFQPVHVYEYDTEALKKYQNKELLFREDYWTNKEKKPRKEKKKKNQIVNQSTKKLSTEECQDFQFLQKENSKKKKERRNANPYYANLREQKALEQERKKNENIRKRKELLQLRAAKKAAQNALQESEKNTKSKGITIILPAKTEPTEDLAVQKQKSPTEKHRKSKKNLRPKKQDPENILNKIAADEIAVRLNRNLAVSPLIKDLNSTEQKVKNGTINLKLFKHKLNKEDQTAKTATAAAAPKVEIHQPLSNDSASSVAQPSKRKKQKNKENNQSKVNLTPNHDKAFNKQHTDKKRRLEELEQIKAEAIAKYQKQHLDGKTELSEQEELKMQRTIQYILRQKGIKR